MPTKIEHLNPSLAELAGQLGGTIYYRGGDWWLGPWDLQITYAVRIRDGERRELDVRGKANLAEEILRRCVEARDPSRWGSLPKRAGRVLHGLRTETAPEFKPRHYCYWRDDSMDHGVVFATPLRGQKSATLDLVGEERIEVEMDGDRTWDDVISGLRVKAEMRYGPIGEAP